MDKIKISIRPSAIIVENSAMLLLQYNYSGINLYQLPGGNMQNLETPQHTLTRELYEELNIQIQTNHLLYCGHTLHEQKKKNTTHLIFSATILSGTPLINPAHTTAQACVWLPLSKLRLVHLYPDIREALFETSNRSKNVPTKYLGIINQHWL
jgi:ADP-ribose pyrophosphatase YjhB (NUDIX family)